MADIDSFSPVDSSSRLSGRRGSSYIADVPPMGGAMLVPADKEETMSDRQAVGPTGPTRRRVISQAISIRGLRSEVKRADGINAKIAVFLTNIVGSMWCAYVFGVIALIGLRPALKPGGEGIIAWIAQTFLQLVLLSVIMVGQNVQSQASDMRSERTYEDAVLILDRLDIHTEGGLKDLADRIESLEAMLRDK